MIIEKRNTKMFNIISIVLLTAILLTVVGGIIVQRLNPPSTLGETGTGRGHSLLQPEVNADQSHGEFGYDHRHRPAYDRFHNYRGAVALVTSQSILNPKKRNFDHKKSPDLNQEIFCLSIRVNNT